MTTVRSQRLAISSHSVARMLGDWENREPGYAALSDRLRVLIMDGRISRGTWLPSERELAVAVSKSRTMVISTYRRLREQGYLTSVRGAGSLVTIPDGAILPLASVTSEGTVNLSRAAPQMWHGLPGIINEAAAAFIDAPGEPFDLVGQPALRQAIADRYTERGCPTRPSQIMVTLGAQQAITLLAQTLLRRGERVLVETPSYPHAIRALRAAGARIDALTSVPVGPGGWDLGRFDTALDAVRPAFSYLMPDFHNPTGNSMDVDTRVHVAARAAQYGTLLIADETTAELSHDEAQLNPPLASFCRDERLIITVGSLSKSVWGGLRVGWIRAYESVIDQLTVTRQHVDLGSPAFEQLAAARVFARLPEALADRRQQLCAARKLVEDFIQTRLPDWQVESPPGGLSMWVNLGGPVSSELAAAGRNLGLTLTPGPQFGVDGEFERHLRIPITEPSETLEHGLELLHDAWSSVRQRPTTTRRQVPSLV
jgi:DNA-binding transcriptional MocR family regulator